MGSGLSTGPVSSHRSEGFRGSTLKTESLELGGWGRRAQGQGQQGREVSCSAPRPELLDQEAPGVKLFTLAGAPLAPSLVL